jgi:nicotinate phosphoribosyltransferase
VTPALLTDFYQLTMAAGYHRSGKQDERATFELFVRRLPPGRDYLVAAGLAQAAEYLAQLRFDEESIAWLQSRPQLTRADPGFWAYLADFRFTGDVFAMPEGTPVYANEPLVSVRAPLIEAQLVETYLLATIGFQTMIATKAAHVTAAAAGRPVVEFGTRRAHSPEAGVLAARAACIGGCVGTSNALAAAKFGLTPFGTAAHSWVLSFEEERSAFLALRDLLAERCVYLIDTYDTIEGARLAASLGAPLLGVRLDSGDLLTLSCEVRRILDQAGLGGAKIMATNELDEEKIRMLLEAGAPIDMFGVGSALATSSDAPTLGAVYKLVEIESGGERRYPAKHSPEKQTLAGAKQVFRYAGHDILGRAGECAPEEGDCTALLQPLLIQGQLTGPLPTAAEARDRFLASRPAGPRPVRLSSKLEALQV